MDWVKTTARRDEKYLSFEIWCDLYKGFYGKYKTLLLFIVGEFQLSTVNSLI